VLKEVISVKVSAGPRERYLVVVLKGVGGGPEFDVIGSSGDVEWTGQFIGDGVALFPVADVERAIREASE
jgi:hypothetical protein